MNVSDDSTVSLNSDLAYNPNNPCPVQSKRLQAIKIGNLSSQAIHTKGSNYQIEMDV